MSSITIPTSNDHGLIEMIFRGDSSQPELEPRCRKVLEKFKLPQRSLICIFDDEERPEFIYSPLLGENFCGFFAPVRQFMRPKHEWPQEIWNHLWKRDEFDLVPDELICDVMIYLRRRTCDSQIGTVITFAHELQHFMQYGFSYKAWRAEGLVQEIYTGGAMDRWSFPAEYEAQLVSKRVAEGVLGGDVIRAYAERQVNDGNNPGKWRFFQELDPAESFELLERTKPWVDKYREALKERFPAHSSDEPDFTKDNWWERKDSLPFVEKATAGPSTPLRSAQDDSPVGG